MFFFVLLAEMAQILKKNKIYICFFHSYGFSHSHSFVPGAHKIAENHAHEENPCSFHSPLPPPNTSTMKSATLRRHTTRNNAHFSAHQPPY
jgi:hypothetical protein